MKTVIKEGNKLFEAICPKCGCHFSYELEDLKDSWVTCWYTLCPECGTECRHPDQSICIPYSLDSETYSSDLNSLSE